MAEEWSEWLPHDGGPCPVPPTSRVVTRGDGTGAIGEARWVLWTDVTAYSVRRPLAVQRLVAMAEGISGKGQSNG